LRFSGPDVALAGRVGGCPLIGAGGGATLIDSLVVAGSMQLESDQSLSISGHHLRIEGALELGGSATLAMDSAIDSLSVLGDATFAGGSRELTNGVLRIGGAFTQ